MKIAQVSPLFESVPPRLYGGTERVVATLTDELVELGHEVALFASGDSKTRAELVACGPTSLRLNPKVYDPIPHHMAMLEKVRRRAHEFDIVHFHTDHLHLPLARALATPSVTTLHSRLDRHDLDTLFSEFGDAHFTAISHSQQSQRDVNWSGVIHHGLNVTAPARPAPSQGEYYLFLGRIAPEKRPDRAIDIARAAGKVLKIAAKVAPKDRTYFEEVVRPRLDGKDTEFIGEVGEKQKTELLSGAAALLFPIDWPEPFGLVMIEAMACGAPVIAWPCGAAAEIIEHGVTGYLVESIADAAIAAQKAISLDRDRIRKRFAERFSARRMALDYLKVYRALARRSQSASLVA